MRRGTIGSPLIVFGGLSPARGTKKERRFCRSFLVPQVGTPACAVRSELLNLRFKMVAFRALQALPIGTRTPGNYSRQREVPYWLRELDLKYEHRRGSF